MVVPAILKNWRFWVAVVIVCLIVFLSWDPAYIVWRTNPNIAFDSNVYGGHAFGIGYKKLSEINLNEKDDDALNDEEKVAARYARVQNECYPKCRDDDACTGFQWRVDTRPLGSHCWLMGDPWKPIKGDTDPSTRGGMWSRRTEWNKHGNNYAAV